jgi:8-oxo-dGTP pyrophosphatase MutT (NUDIX family)
MLYRKGVAVIIENTKSEILLVNLTSFEEQYFAVPGGGSEEGEKTEDTVYREMFEELGITKDNLVICKIAEEPIKFTFKKGPKIMHGVEYVGQEKLYVYTKFTGTDEDIKLDQEEVRKYVWTTIENMGEYIKFPGELELALEEIKKLKS